MEETPGAHSTAMSCPTCCGESGFLFERHVKFTQVMSTTSSRHAFSVSNLISLSECAYIDGAAKTESA